MSLETRGYRPKSGERGPISAYLQIKLAQEMRKRVSIELIHGNSWSGWLENGNPHGEHRPGLVTAARGIQIR